MIASNQGVHLHHVTIATAWFLACNGDFFLTYFFRNMFDNSSRTMWNSSVVLLVDWYLYRLEVAFALFWFGSTKWAAKKVLGWQNAKFHNGMIEMFDLSLKTRICEVTPKNSRGLSCNQATEQSCTSREGHVVIDIHCLKCNPDVSIESETDWRWRQNQGNGSIDSCRRTPARPAIETTKTAGRLRNFCHLLIRFIPQDEPLLASRSARTEEFIGLSCRYAACHAELLCRWCRFEGPSRQDVLRTGTDTETTEIDHVSGTWSQLNQCQQDAPKSKLLEEATHFQDGNAQR